MCTEYDLHFNGTYIRLVHSPDFEITPESQEKMWAEVSQACKRYDCLKILAEGPAPKRRMELLDALESGQLAAHSIPGLSMAVCLQGYIGDEITRFFTDVAHNRGAHIEFFTSREEALHWLGVEAVEHGSEDDTVTRTP